MNPQIQSEKPAENEIYMENALTEKDALAEKGFAPEEILALLWLRQWYQTGGSDRAPVMRHLEFLKQLVITGKLEL